MLENQTDITIPDNAMFKQKHFREILNEWCCVIKEYANFDPEDALYWCNERTSVGNLAVAASRHKFHVLEEFVTQKKWKKKIYSGRCDLYLITKIDGVKFEYVFEAKQQFISISPRATATFKRIRAIIKAARKAAKQSVLVGDEGAKNTYAMVFLVPYIPKYCIENKENLIVTFLQKLESVVLEDHKMTYVGQAYVFPKQAQPYYEDALYPGAICLLFGLK